ncbi:MAG: serine/threonine protein kinase [Spirochaetes bacterium]|nr:serine/threonine protein kinase [Spirochaetota bacterium]
MDKKDKNTFYELDQHAVLSEMEKCGFSVSGHCMALNSYENRVYDIRLEDGAHIVAKFYRPGRWSMEQIQEEHDFLFQLRDAEIPVCAPVLFDDGTSIHEADGIYYAVWPRTGGRITDEFTDIQLGMLGRYVARIHNTGAAEKCSHRISLTGENYGLKPLRFLLDNDFIPGVFIDRYTNAVNEVVRLYDGLSAGVPFHRVHGDCHHGNLLNGNDGFFFLDFDDFLNGPAVQDVWMIVPARDPHGLHQREVFLDAYREFRDFSNSWLALIEPLRMLRFIHYAGWIARRWTDPAFPHIFPHFGTDQYWEQETRDLENQLEYIYSKKGLLPDEYRKIEEEPESDLTNSDFFWDM